jgi:N-acetylmuramoyl-L-alanine amidase
LVVIHYTAMQGADAAIKVLRAPARQVSAHYVIAAQGDITQLVHETNRAWHAGAGQWHNITDVNSHSIGIELDNSGFAPFAAPLMDALEQLLADIMGRHTIPPQNVIGHSDLAPTRKIDPGPRFDWRRLARRGLSVWPKCTAPTNIDPAVFYDHATQFGYAPLPLGVILQTMRARFRPWAKGPLDGWDCAIMADLAQRFAR